MPQSAAPSETTFDVVVYYRDEQPASAWAYLGEWSGLAASIEDAESKARDHVWDERLDITSCVAKFHVTEQSKIRETAPIAVESDQPGRGTGDASDQARIAELTATAYAKLRDAEKAWHALFCAHPVGERRVFCSDVYDKIRNAART